jgi:hypothetical protein
MVVSSPKVNTDGVAGNSLALDLEVLGWSMAETFAAQFARCRLSPYLDQRENDQLA